MAAAFMSHGSPMQMRMSKVLDPTELLIPIEPLPDIYVIELIIMTEIEFVIEFIYRHEQRRLLPRLPEHFRLLRGK